MSQLHFSYNVLYSKSPEGKHINTILSSILRTAAPKIFVVIYDCVNVKILCGLVCRRQNHENTSAFRSFLRLQSFGSTTSLFHATSHPIYTASEWNHPTAARALMTVLSVSKCGPRKRSSVFVLILLLLLYVAIAVVFCSPQVLILYMWSSCF